MEYNMTNLKEFTRDYTTRTIANYNKICEIHSENNKKLKREETEEVFEVTQLINSLFGILIMPFESVKANNSGKINVNYLRVVNKRMRETNEDAFNDLSEVIRELKQSKHFYDTYLNDYEKDIAEIAFIHRLRNSLAHSGKKGLHFYPIGDSNQERDQIQSIIFCDEGNVEKKEEFIAELSVAQVERVVRSLVAIFGDYGEFNEVADYQRDIRSMRDKMKSVYEGVFEFNKEHRGEVEKKFKGNLVVENLDNRRLRGYTIVNNEMEFLYWIYQSEGKYKIVAPEKLCKKMKKMISEDI